MDALDPITAPSQTLLHPDRTQRMDLMLHDPLMRRLVIVGVLFHLVTAWMSAGFYYPDEHFQILEFAGLKLGFNQPADLAWEYTAHIRPSLQPWLAYAAVSGLDQIGLTDPFAQARVLRFLSAALSLVSLLLLLREQLPRTDSRRAARWMLGLSLLLWFVPFFNVRFASETWSADFLVLGLVGLLRGTDTGLKPSGAMVAGVLFGLAFLFRYQIAFMIVGAVAWLLLIRRESLKALLPMLVGGLLVLACGVLLDRAFYGDWVFAPWSYLQANLIEGKAAAFGTLPWWGYFKLMVEPPRLLFGALIIVTFFAYFVLHPRSLLSWVSLPFLLAHMAIGHKELRFLLPLANFTGIFFVMSIAELDRRGLGVGPGIARDRLVKWSRIAFLTINIPALVFMAVRPATFALAPLRELLELKGDDRLVLLYPKDQMNPLGAEVKLHFYQPPDLLEQPLDRLEDIPRYVDAQGKYVLFIFHKTLDTIAPLQFSGVHCDIVKRPSEWVVKHMNFGDWVGRFGIGVFYLCRPPSPGPSRQEDS